MAKSLFTGKKRHFVARAGDEHEKTAWRAGSTLAGVDEVGRGCLAGPLVAAAVELPIWATKSPETAILRDSKLMTERQRKIAHGWITEHCRYGVGIIHPRGVDSANIWQATLLAMKRAMYGLLVNRQKKANLRVILVDAMPLDLRDSCYDIPVLSFPKAEQQSLSVAAASILAKVTRDQLMAQLDRYFPAYGLAGHKGYATAVHRTAILRDGHSLIHRLSFLRRMLEEGSENGGTQQRLC